MRVDLDGLLRICLAKEGAYLDFPFGDGCAIVKVNGRIFAELFERNGEPMFTFSTDGDTAIALRLQYPEAIARGWHCPPVQAKYKSTATVSKLDGKLLERFAHISYEYVVAKGLRKTKI